MISSMTGFGAGSSEWAQGRFRVSIRSVNHRFMDVVIRLPVSLQALEKELRDEVRRAMHRGRVEVSIEEGGDGPAGSFHLNLAAARSLSRLAEELLAAGLVTRGLSAAEMLQFPQVLASGADPCLEISDERRAALSSALEIALSAVVASRSEEGRGLSVDLAQILAQLSGSVDQVRVIASRLRAELPGQYAERVRRILDAIGLEDRTEQFEVRLLEEAGVLAERVDVSEEVERLDVHLASARSALVEGEPCGRRLDFLAQELLREFNTVASKCRDADLATVIVECKVQCDRLREQVQNIE